MDVAVVEELELVGQVEADPARQGGGGEVDMHDARGSDRPGVAVLMIVLLFLLLFPVSFVSFVVTTFTFASHVVAWRFVLLVLVVR